MFDFAVNNTCAVATYAGRMETMGDRIKRLRVARRLTQEQVAERCQVSKQAVSQWESGLTENIRLQNFLLLLETFQTDAEYLIWGPSRQPPDGVGRRDRHSKG